jgi:hypothetical protein
MSEPATKPIPTADFTSVPAPREATTLTTSTATTSDSTTEATTAVAPTPGDGATPTASDTVAEASSLLKSKVAKTFPVTTKAKNGKPMSRTYIGTVTEEWKDPTDGRLMYSIRYFDGDTEDMDEDEVQEAIRLYGEVKARQADAVPIQKRKKDPAPPSRKSPRNPIPRKEIYSVLTSVSGRADKKRQGRPTTTAGPTKQKRTKKNNLTGSTPTEEDSAETPSKPPAEAFPTADETPQVGATTDANGGDAATTDAKSGNEEVIVKTED